VKSRGKTPDFTIAYSQNLSIGYIRKPGGYWRSSSVC
jgi:hypothetical protein